MTQRSDTKSTNEHPRVVIAAGGTGGHLFPAKALSEQISLMGGTCYLITDSRGEALSSTDKVFRICAAPMSGHISVILNTLKLGWGTLQALWHLYKLKPDIVVGFGGYASAPTVWAANKLLKIPTIIHEQNAVMGKANRFLAPNVDHIATSFPDIKGIRNIYKDKIEQTGNPVRKEIERIRNKPYPTFNHQAPIKLLIIGGSGGAKIFSDIVPHALHHLAPAFLDRLEIVHQVRQENIESAKEAYGQLDVKVTVMPFIDHIEKYIQESHLILCRGGASTIAELAIAGRPAIIVPLPNSRDDHQMVNARMFEEVGGGWVIPQEGFTERSFCTKLETLFGLPKLLENAAQKAKSSAKIKAAEKLAKLVYKTVNP